MVQFWNERAWYTQLGLVGKPIGDRPYIETLRYQQIFELIAREEQAERNKPSHNSGSGGRR